MLEEYMLESKHSQKHLLPHEIATYCKDASSIYQKRYITNCTFSSRWARPYRRTHASTSITHVSICRATTAALNTAETPGFLTYHYHFITSITAADAHTSIHICISHITKSIRFYFKWDFSTPASVRILTRSLAEHVYKGYRARMLIILCAQMCLLLSLNTVERANILIFCLLCLLCLLCLHVATDEEWRRIPQ